MELKNKNPAAGDGGALQEFSLALKIPKITATSRTAQDRRPRRRMATPAERQQAREVAAFVHAGGLAERPLLVVLALIARCFPDIGLDTALTGYVFRELLAPELDGRRT
jgi:hypothetical protein